jgi:hypothetical protein
MSNPPKRFLLTDEELAHNLQDRILKTLGEFALEFGFVKQPNETPEEYDDRVDHMGVILEMAHLKDFASM